MSEPAAVLTHITVSRQSQSMLYTYYHEAEHIGPSASLYMRLLIEKGRSEKTMLHGCQGIIRLCRVFGQERLEAACARGLRGNKYNYKTIKNILINRLDEQEDDLSRQEEEVATTHLNLRGASSFE